MQEYERTLSTFPGVTAPPPNPPNTYETTLSTFPAPTRTMTDDTSHDLELNAPRCDLDISVKGAETTAAAVERAKIAAAEAEGKSGSNGPEVEAEVKGKEEGKKAEEGARPDTAAEAVLKPSDPVPEHWEKVKGFEFDNFRGRDVTVRELLNGMGTMGFQGSELAKAKDVINGMRNWRSEDGEKATIFLGYTSNLISSGLRETLRYLTQHKHISAIVTTAGGIEEDLIKCLAPTYLGAFSLDGATLRSKGLNRIGNLLVPNDNYCKFEDWIIPIFDKMLEEQEATKNSEEPVIWTPSTIIRRLGLEIKDESSVLYWAAKNDIPIFCPALTDGSIGDMLYFHTFKSSPAAIRCDIVQDIRKINTMAVRAKAAGAVVLGGGVVKHHINNACLMRNGAEWMCLVNTASEFDGSDAGARVDEAVSWGKVKAGAESVKVTAEATVVFPMLVAATWAAQGKN